MKRDKRLVFTQLKYIFCFNQWVYFFNLKQNVNETLSSDFTAEELANVLYDPLKITELSLAFSHYARIL